MKKLVIFSMMASPHQVRFVPYLARYFDVQHYFYDRLANRQSFWKVDLGDRCHILPCKFKWRSKFLTLSVFSVLRREKPDILNNIETRLDLVTKSLLADIQVTWTGIFHIHCEKRTPLYSWK